MVRLCMWFGSQTLACRVTPDVAAELVGLFGPDAYSMESEGAE
jgi:hypothetical protein